jgi:hypothetical protein
LRISAAMPMLGPGAVSSVSSGVSGVSVTRCPFLVQINI